MASPATIQFPEFPRERYGPGQSVASFSAANDAVVPKASAKAGDFILTHSSGIFGQLIRFGEHLRYTGSEKVFAHCHLEQLGG